ncbi:hypothetical protein F5883DRAFT_56886 [Diaporthe sp. PMI_573]|nr:hypothetical protein F5883DRAFT_56886 [Diaporthaceae sp. PMI_573]
MWSTHCWVRSARCCGAAGCWVRVGMGSVMGCRLWTISACRRCRAVSWCRGSGRLQTDSNGIPYHAYLGRHAADMHPHPHQNPHPQCTHQPVDQAVRQSVSQSVSQQVGRSVGRGRSSRIVSGGGPVSTTQRAAASRSPPAGLAHYRCHTRCAAVMLRCFAV